MPRVATRSVALAAATLTLASVSGPAGAQVPENWSDPKPVSFLHALLVLGGIPLALFVLIAVLVSLPGWVSGAGTALASPDNEINRSFGSGFGVRLLDRLVTDQYERH